MDKLVKAKEWLIGCVSYIFTVLYCIVGLVLSDKKLMTINYNLPWYLYGLIAISSILFLIFIIAPKGRNTHEFKEIEVNPKTNKWVNICAVVVYVGFAVAAIVLYSFVGKGNIANIVDICFGITGFILCGFVYFFNKILNIFLNKKKNINDR